VPAACASPSTRTPASRSRCPPARREREAALAVAELRPWIERRLAEVRAARERLAAPAGHVTYLGAHLRLAPEAGRVRVHRRADTLLVPGDEPRAALERWYRRAARAEIAPRLDDAVAALGRAYRSSRSASSARAGARARRPAP